MVLPPIFHAEFRRALDYAQARIVDQDIGTTDFACPHTSNNVATSVLPLTSAALPTTLRCAGLGERLTASSTRSWLRPQMATVAPASDSARATAKPMPRVPPVTSAVSPLRKRFVHESILRWDAPLHKAHQESPRPSVLPAIPLVNWVMLNAKPSRTAQRVATRRAAHQILDQPRVFDDPLAAAIAGEEAEPPESVQQPFSRAFRAFLAVRSRYAEDQLARAVERGVRQYVVLGAGLDTFAYRNPLRSWAPCLRSGSSGDTGVEARPPRRSAHSQSQRR